MSKPAENLSDDPAELRAMIAVLQAENVRIVAAISEVSAPDAPHVVTTTSGATLDRPARLNPHKSRRDQFFDLADV